jgi:hypothetical protein
MNNNGKKHITLAIGPEGAIVAHEILQFQRDERLDGQAIRVTDAAAKYDVAYQTLTRWAEYGYIRTLRHEPRHLELDEADVKLCAQIYNIALQHTTNRMQAGWLLKSALAA